MLKVWPRRRGSIWSWSRYWRAPCLFFTLFVGSSGASSGISCHVLMRSPFSFSYVIGRTKMLSSFCAKCAKTNLSEEKRKGWGKLLAPLLSRILCKMSNEHSNRETIGRWWCHESVCDKLYKIFRILVSTSSWSTNLKLHSSPACKVIPLSRKERMWPRWSSPSCKERVGSANLSEKWETVERFLFKATVYLGARVVTF